MNNFIFPSGISEDLCAKNKEIEGQRAPLPHYSTQRKKNSTIVLDTTAYVCVNNLNHVTNDTPKLKYFKVLSIKSHFMLSKAFSKSMKSRRLGICFVFAFLMMLSMILIFCQTVPFLRKPVWSLLLIFGRTFSTRLAMDLSPISQRSSTVSMVTRQSRSTSNFYAVIGQDLTGEFMLKIYEAS